MNAYIVFAGRKWKSVIGERGITWNHENAILGVFKAPTPEEACQAAAIKAGFAGTFFAIEGVTWGIDEYETSVKEYGAPDDTDDKLSQLERALTVVVNRLISAESVSDASTENDDDE